jgi:hypothetical protein
MEETMNTLSDKIVRKPRSKNFKTDLTTIIPVKTNSCSYFRFSKSLFSKLIDNNGDEVSKFEAFVLMVANVNYNDNKIFDDIICHRGESYRSQKGWAKIFNWNRSKTRRFFIWLQDNGVIEFDNVGVTTRIKIIDYDYCVGSPNIGDEKYSEDFETFWKDYHRITSLRATDKVAASRIWSKLSSQEKTKAKTKISNYYYNLGKISYCVKAVNYLKNKNFNDQFYQR